MKNNKGLRLMGLIKKDFLMAKNKISHLFFFYGLYFVVCYFSLRGVAPILSTLEGNLKTLIACVFFFQSVFILSFILFPQFIYRESMTDKHEIYFAYRYSILEIVIGKTAVLISLSLIPSLIIILVLFYPLLEFSIYSVITLFFVTPLLAFGFLAVNVLFSWFTRMGRFLSTGFLLLLIFLMSQFQRIHKQGLNLSTEIIFLSFLAFSVLLLAIVIVSSRFIKKEKCILRI